MYTNITSLLAPQDKVELNIINNSFAYSKGILTLNLKLHLVAEDLPESTDLQILRKIIREDIGDTTLHHTSTHPHNLVKDLLDSFIEQISSCVSDLIISIQESPTGSSVLFEHNIELEVKNLLDNIGWTYDNGRNTMMILHHKIASKSKVRLYPNAIYSDKLCHTHLQFILQLLKAHFEAKNGMKSLQHNLENIRQSDCAFRHMVIAKNNSYFMLVLLLLLLTGPTLLVDNYVNQKHNLAEVIFGILFSLFTSVYLFNLGRNLYSQKSLHDAIAIARKKLRKALFKILINPRNGYQELPR